MLYHLKPVHFHIRQSTSSQIITVYLLRLKIHAKVKTSLFKQRKIFLLIPLAEKILKSFKKKKVRLLLIIQEKAPLFPLPEMVA